MSAFDLKLDATSKAKLQTTISSKLASISTYTDDVLPEYVMVMVQNKKSLAQVTSDLSAFLGKDAASFSQWLWELLDSFMKGKDLPETTTQKKEEEKKEEEPKPTGRKLASVIAPSVSPQRSERSRRDQKESRRDREGRKEERGRGERRYEKEQQEDEMEEERGFKPSVNSVIATSEMEKRPSPKEMNMPSRLILNAVKQAVDDSNSPQSPTTSRKVLKPGSRSARMDEEGEVNITVVMEGNKVTKKRGSWENEENEEADNKKAKQVRCQYWPNCKRGEACVFHHPKERCKNYPNCTFGSQCLYIHPISDAICKYAANCTKADCTFTHPPPTSNIPCNGGFACFMWNGDNCGFQHPPVACKFGDKCTKGTSCTFSHGVLCKFGSRCTRPACTFSHPTSSTFSKPARLSQNTCKFGLNCKNKDTCTFSHPDDNEGVDTTALSESLPKTPPRD